jgi:hypothetical protein
MVALPRRHYEFEGVRVATRRALQHGGFSPVEVERLSRAYEDALRTLGLVDRTDPVTEIVAKKIIEIATTGESDPAAISARAIADLGIPLQPN